MDKINSFLDKTDLSVRDEIILAISVYIICSIIFPLIFKVFKNIFNAIMKRIKKQLLKIKTKKARKLRWQSGDLFLGEYMDLLKKKESNEQLNDEEKTALDKCKNQMTIKINDKIIDDFQDLAGKL